ncbi:MAG: hypothetical protein ACRDZM_04160 [Acidimicrobiia bacterium]
MADRDAAFLWETEALRSAGESAEPGARRPAPSATRAPEGWLTLRQASAATGIPVATLRKWALKGHVPSVLDDSAPGGRRMVPLEEVRARARRLGREPGGPSAPASETGDEAPAPATPPEVDPPPGTMIVPIDAWDKMLLQLGNLHEAGQQLAEARERAARAETEAMFLRERLTEMREANHGQAEGQPIPEPAGPTQPSTIPSFTAYLWRSAVSGLRRKK